MFCRIRTVRQQPMSPLQPPVRNRLLAPERGRIPGEPEGHPRCPQAIVALTIDAIRAFADVAHDLGQVEPPGGEPQTFERLRILLGLQRQFEREAGRLPVATTKRRPAGVETVDRRDRRDELAAGGLSLHNGGSAQITSTARGATLSATLRSGESRRTTANDELRARPEINPLFWPPMHPAGRRCSSLSYTRYARSSRL